MKLEKKLELRRKRVWRIRKKVRGTAERPRLCLHLSNKHIYAQAIDDERGKTLVSAASTSRGLREENLKANVEGAVKLGAAFGEKAGKFGIRSVVFDRNGRRYHGAVKAFSEAARKSGLEF